MFSYNGDAVAFVKSALKWTIDGGIDIPTTEKGVKDMLMNYKHYLNKFKKDNPNCDFRTTDGKNTLKIALAISTEWSKNSFTCCICGKKSYGWGNNPYPLCDVNDYTSRCCDECDNNFVIPARIAMYVSKKGGNDNGKK